MKTYKSIKKVLSISALTLLSTVSQCWAAGGVGTGGGNPIAAKPNVKPYVPELKKIILEARPMLRAEFNGLRNWSSCDPRNCEADPFMQARKRLLQDEKKTRKLIDNFKLTLLEDKPCEIKINGNVIHRAASATPPDKICLSLSEISQYEVSGDDVNFSKKMIKGLFFHEFVHLLGGDEAEAEILQKKIAPMGNGDWDSTNAVYNIRHMTENTTTALSELNETLNSIVSGNATDAATCLKLVSIYGNFNKKIQLSEQEDWDYYRATIRLSAAARGYCSPDKEFTDFFKNRTKISELDYHLPMAQKISDEFFRKIEIERAQRLSSPTVFFTNLANHSKEDLVKELNLVQVDLVKILEALKEMAKF